MQSHTNELTYTRLVKTIDFSCHAELSGNESAKERERERKGAATSLRALGDNIQLRAVGFFSLLLYTNARLIYTQAHRLK